MRKQIEKVKTLAKLTYGIFRTADLKRMGLTVYDIQKLHEMHAIEQIVHEYYTPESGNRD